MIEADLHSRARCAISSNKYASLVCRTWRRL
jgi:hypothetical protein